MKRSISDQEYAEIAKRRQNCLDYSVILQEKRIVLDYKFWVVVNNEYPYVEFDGNKVLEHKLIVPKRDSIEKFEDLSPNELSELTKVIRDLKNSSNEFLMRENISLMLFWLEKGRSVKKFHIHFLVTQKEER